jgi:branched-chain amino acid aminotransferase
MTGGVTPHLLPKNIEFSKAAPMNGIVSINGEIFPLEKAKISVMDRGFLFGDAIFEVIVGFNKKLVALDEHLNRLRQSGKRIGFELPWTDEDLRREVLNVYSQSDFPKTYLRIGITRGEGLGIIPNNSSYNRLIYALPAYASPSRIYSDGIRVKTQSKMSTTRGPSIKNPFSLTSIVEMIELQKKGYDDVLWVNNEQEITEASTSNIFFIGRDGNTNYVETPALECGLLGGITRYHILKLLAENKIEVRESSILQNEFARFDEAFLSSTIRGLVPIREIDDKKFSSTRPTAFFHTIDQLFQNWISQEVGKHYDWNTGLD